LAFAGTIPLAGLASAIITQWIFKSVYEVLATPFTYWMVNSLKKSERLDVYDLDTRFNPLLIGE
jgi:hypothetical protein